MDTHQPALVPTHVGGRVPAPVLPPVLIDKVAALRDASKAPATRRAYVSDWRAWETWCLSNGASPLPAHPDTVSAYLADRAGVLKVATLSRHLATISKAHQVAGLPNPCREVSVRDTLAGLRRTHGTPPNQAPGLLPRDLAATVDTMSSDLAGLRDRALFLVGWSGALRRSEIAAITWGDLTPDADGMVLTLPRSKTDQAGEGSRVGIPRQADPGRCPVVALERWRHAVAHERGAAVAPNAPVFVSVTRWGHLGTQALTGQSVAAIIQRRTRDAGLPVTYRGHSLRAGLVQAAHLAGVADSAVMATTRHKGVGMVRRYQGDAGLVSRSAARGLLA
jgi:integrase